MSTFRDRTGERLGHLEVIERHHRNDKQGRVIWRVRDHSIGHDKYMKTYELSKIAKAIESGKHEANE